jgi:hypothetical protein
MTTNGREFLADHLPLWHGPRARCGKGVHPDDLADPSKAQTEAETRDAAGVGDRRLRKQATTHAAQHPQSEQAADDPSKNAEAAKGEPHAIVPATEHGSATQPASNLAPEN